MLVGWTIFGPPIPALWWRRQIKADRSGYTTVAIKFTCICGEALSAEDARPGQRVRCPRCGAVVVVPVPPQHQGPAIKISLEDVAKASVERPKPAAASAPSRTPASSSRADTPEPRLPQTMRASRRFEGKTCSICQAQFRLGEELRICEHCQLPFHMSCWEANGGCATYGCAGVAATRPKQVHADFSLAGGALSQGPSAADLPQYPPPPSAAPNWVRANPPVPPRTSGMAVASLVLGLLGWWLCGIGSLLAVIFGHQALSQINASNGMVTGRGMAIAGLVLGYLGLAAILLIFFLAVAAPS